MTKIYNSMNCPNCRLEMKYCPREIDGIDFTIFKEAVRCWNCKRVSDVRDKYVTMVFHDNVYRTIEELEKDAVDSEKSADNFSLLEFVKEFDRIVAMAGTWKLGCSCMARYKQLMEARSKVGSL